MLPKQALQRRTSKRLVIVKEERDMSKRKKWNLICLIAVILIASLITSPYSTASGLIGRGAQKDFDREETVSLGLKNETVFVTLAADGSVLQKRIVNRIYGLEEPKAAWVIDFGEYEEVQNKVSLHEALVEENKVYWPASLLKERDLFYEGVPKVDIPITFSIQYVLNGESKKPEEIIGESGELAIHISMENHLTRTEAVHYETLEGRQITAYEKTQVPLLVQGTLPIDVRIFSDVKIKQGSIVEAGKTASVGFLAFLDPKDEIIITLYGEDMELDEMMFTVLPELPGSLDIDMEEDLIDLWEGLDALGKGIKDMRTASDQLTQGIGDADAQIMSMLVLLLSGTEGLEVGLANLIESAKKIERGTAEADEGLAYFFERNLEGLEEISAGLMELYDASDSVLEGLMEYRDGLNTIIVPMLPAVEGLLEMLSYIDDMGEEEIIEWLKRLMDFIDEFKDILYDAPSSEVEQHLNLLLQEKEMMQKAISTAENDLNAAGKHSQELLEKAEWLKEGEEKGSDRYVFGEMVIEQQAQIQAAEESFSLLKQSFPKLDIVSEELEEEWDQWSQYFVKRVENMLKAFEKETGQDFCDGAEIMAHIKHMLEKSEDLKERLEEFQSLLVSIKEMPGALDELVEAQRQIRDGIKLIHDEGVLEIKRAQEMGAQEFDLSPLAQGLWKMIEGMEKIQRLALQDMAEGLQEAKDKFTLAPLADGQKQLSRGLQSVLDEGVVPMKAGLKEGIDDIRFAEALEGKMKDLAENYVSLMDEERNIFSRVQFVFRTQRLHKAEEVEDIEEAEEEKLTLQLLWQRLVDLFITEEE